MGKVHGGLANSGKVRGQTPKVDPMEKPKKKTGRAAMRAKYNRRFTVVGMSNGHAVYAETRSGKGKGPNSQQLQAKK